MFCEIDEILYLDSVLFQKKNCMLCWRSSLFTNSAGNDVSDVHPTSAAASTTSTEKCFSYIDDDDIEVIDLSQFPSLDTFYRAVWNADAV